MRTVVLASISTYARRYIAATLAVVIGVAFILVTAAVSSSTKSGLLAGVSEAYRGADVVVQGLSPDAAQSTLDAVADLGPASVNADASAPVSVDGVTVADEPDIGSVATESSLRWQDLAAGRYPTRPGEVLADAADAATNQVSVGDELVIDAGAKDIRVTVTGLAEASLTQLSASLYVLWPDMRELGDRVAVTDVVVGGTDVGAVEGAGLPKFAEAVSADEHLRDLAADVTREVDTVAAMLLLFAGIALFVSVLVIANTFTVLLAQRLRDFALLRCVGATRKQVLRSVRREALVIGVLASTLGVLVGLVLGRGFVATASHFIDALPTGDVSVSWVWIAVAWAVGVLVTLVASLLPARRSTAINPLAALRPQEGVDLRTSAGLQRLGLGGVLLAFGGAMLVFSMVNHVLLVMIGGGFLSFFGVLLFGPVLVPACVRVAGLVTGRVFGAPGRLATSNAVRNPRRTAATAASLLVGTTLITGMVTGMSTIRGSVENEMDVEYPLDVTLTSAQPFDAGPLRQVRAIDGIKKAIPVKAATARIGQGGKRLGELTVLGVPDDRSVLRGEPRFAAPAPGTVYVSWDQVSDLGLDPGAPSTLTVGSRRLELRTVPTFGFKGTALVSPEVLDRLAAPAADRSSAQLSARASTRAIWALASDDVDAEATQGALNAVAKSTGAELGGGMSKRAYVDLQLNIMVVAVLALLGVALVIALIGIGNTLGLSVLERTREHALLRAMGLTRGQLRGTLAVEAVLLATVTSVIGVALGTIYAFVGVKAVLGEVLGETGVSLHVPVGQLLLVVLVAALAGLAACVLPARNAARVTPAAGLAVE
jgi:putative ABC transport system permease protein